LKTSTPGGEGDRTKGKKPRITVNPGRKKKIVKLPIRPRKSGEPPYPFWTTSRKKKGVLSHLRIKEGQREKGLGPSGNVICREDEGNTFLSHKEEGLDLQLHKRNRKRHAIRSHNQRNKGTGQFPARRGCGGKSSAEKIHPQVVKKKRGEKRISRGGESFILEKEVSSRQTGNQLKRRTQAKGPQREVGKRKKKESTR